MPSRTATAYPPTSGAGIARAAAGGHERLPETANPITECDKAPEPRRARTAVLYPGRRSRARLAGRARNGHSERVSVRAELPGFVTHYYLAGRRPFLSLSELGDAELAAVLAELGAFAPGREQHRPFGPR